MKPTEKVGIPRGISGPEGAEHVAAEFGLNPSRVPAIEMARIFPGALPPAIHFQPLRGSDSPGASRAVRAPPRVRHFKQSSANLLFKVRGFSLPLSVFEDRPPRWPVGTVFPIVVHNPGHGLGKQLLLSGQ